MKKLLAISALSTKLLMLLCISFMGVVMSMPVSAQENIDSPCHVQNEIKADSKKITDTSPCSMCETALESLDVEGVFSFQSLEDAEQKISLPLVAIPDLMIPLKIFLRYDTYYPPPIVVWKSVTPLTKTIVLVV